MSVSQSGVPSHSLNIDDLYDQNNSPRSHKSRHRAGVLYEVYPEIASCVANQASAKQEARPPNHFPSFFHSRLSPNNTGTPGAEKGMESTWAESIAPPDPFPRPDTLNWTNSRPPSEVHIKGHEHVQRFPVGVYSNLGFVPQVDRRMPPANPHKSRRRCIDFGLSRTPAVSPSPPPTPDYLTVESPLLAAHPGLDSDSSSLFDDLEMVFPQPPPIFMSLRRVRSSPLLSSKDVPLAKSDVEKCWDRDLRDYSSNKYQSMVHSATSARTGRRVSMGRPDRRLEERKLREALVSSIEAPAMNVTHSHPLAARTPGSRECVRRITCVPTSATSSKPQKPINLLRSSRINECHNVALHDSKYTLADINSGASAVTGKRKTLSHTRSTSSLLPSLPRIIQRETCATFRTTQMVLPTVKPVVPVAVSDSREYLEWSVIKPKPLSAQRLDYPGIGSYLVDAKGVSPCPSRAPPICTGRQRRAHLSNPFVGLGFANASLVPPRSLGSPFHHRPTRSQPVARATMNGDPSHLPKSFVDITPEQNIRDSTSHTRRELMIKLLVKASRGVLGWSKILTQRKQST